MADLRAAAGRALLDAVAGVAAAVGHPTRVRLVTLLAQSDKPVDRLAEETGGSLANTSAHLHVLAAVGLVSPDRRGRHVFYRVTDPSVGALLSSLEATAEAVAPRYLSAARVLTAGVPSFDGSLASLASDVRSGRISLVDLRIPEEYAAGHLPGAVSIPFETLSRAVRRLPRDRRVVAYCRGPYCATAVEGVRRLRARHVDAVRVPFGVAEWRAAGRRLEAGLEGGRA